MIYLGKTEGKPNQIWKILKVDYPRGKPRAISPTLFQQKSWESNFHYFTPLFHLRRDISPENQGEYMETSQQTTRNLLIQPLAHLNL